MFRPKLIPVLLIYFVLLWKDCFFNFPKPIQQKITPAFQGNSTDDKGQGVFTASVCYKDLVAPGVMAALAAMKISLPDKISFLGDDDIPVENVVFEAEFVVRKSTKALLLNLKSQLKSIGMGMVF